MSKVKREGIERQRGPELVRYINVTDASTRSGLDSLYHQLGPDVLDDADRTAMFGQPVAPVETPNNVINFPVSQPVLGEMATGSAGIAPQAEAAPLGNVAPVEPFPPIQPPYADAA